MSDAVAASGPPRDRVAAIAVGALALAAVLHVVELFPAQGGGVPSQAHTVSLVVMQAILAAGWLAAAACTAVARLRPAGVAVAAGLAASELGFVVANVGQVAAGTSLGAGSYLAALAWVAGLAGVLVGLRASRGSLGRPVFRSAPPGMLAPLTAVVSIVLGVALLPAWDRYLLDLRVTGRVLTLDLGSAFSHTTPTSVLVGDLIAAAAFAVVPLVAVLWRPGRLGALCSAGVLVAATAQLCSAVSGFSVSSPTALGVPATQVRALGVVVGNSALTAWFDVEVLAALALAVLLVARWWTPEHTPAGAGWAWPVSSGVAAGGPGWAPAGPGWPVAAPPGWGGQPSGWGSEPAGWGAQPPGWGADGPSWGGQGPGGADGPSWGGQPPGWGSEAPGWAPPPAGTGPPGTASAGPSDAPGQRAEDPPAARPSGWGPPAH